MITLLGQTLLIKRFDEKEEIRERAKESGIIIEENNVSDINAVERGEIIAVGNKADSWDKMVGQKVYFNSWAGNEIEFDEQKLFIVHINDILATY